MTRPAPGDRALIVLVPDPIGTEINRWRRRYDPNHSIVPPHITVAYPPFIPEEAWPSERTTIQDCLGAFRPFHVNLREPGMFEADRYVLWLKAEDGGHLVRIRDALMQCIPQYVPALPFEYIPHVTLGLFESEEAMHRAQEELRSQMKLRSFLVRELAYLSPDQRGVWCVCSRIPLRGNRGRRMRQK